MATATMDRPSPPCPEPEGITTRVWREGKRPCVTPMEATYDAGAVAHFDVPHGADPVAVYDALRPICGADLTFDMVEDLLDPDELPKIERHDEAGRIRAVSAFSASASGPAPDAGVSSGRLTFNLVEFLANDHWLVTCSHRAKSYAGTSAHEEGHSSAGTCEQIVDDVARRWCSARYQTAGDLGVLFLHEMTCTYSDTWRELMAWLDQWERRLYDDPHVEQQTLKDLRALSSEFRSRLNALNVPQDEAGSAWFSGVSDPLIAKRADRHIDRALDALDRLGDMLRSAFGLLQANATAYQLEVAQKQQKETEGLQRKLELVTVLFLVPTLIAGTWGENTWVPGQGRPWGFVLTVVTMVTGAALAWLWLESRRSRRERS